MVDVGVPLIRALTGVAVEGGGGTGLLTAAVHWTMFGWAVFIICIGVVMLIAFKFFGGEEAEGGELFLKVMAAALTGLVIGGGIGYALVNGVNAIGPFAFVEQYGPENVTMRAPIKLKAYYKGTSTLLPDGTKVLLYWGDLSDPYQIADLAEEGDLPKDKYNETTISSGEFTFDNVAPGKYKLVIYSASPGSGPVPTIVTITVTDERDDNGYFICDRTSVSAYEYGALSFVNELGQDISSYTIAPDSYPYDMSDEGLTVWVKLPGEDYSSGPWYIYVTLANDNGAISKIEVNEEKVDLSDLSDIKDVTAPIRLNAPSGADYYAGPLTAIAGDDGKVPITIYGEFLGNETVTFTIISGAETKNLAATMDSFQLILNNKATSTGWALVKPAAEVEIFAI